MPAAPLVGAVTTRPPEAFSSFTASAHSGHPVQRPRAGRRRVRKRPARAISSRVQVGGPPPDLEPARQHARGRAAVADALDHHPPDPQQAGPDLGLGPACALVGQHHVADREVVVGADVRAARSPVRNGYGTGVGSGMSSGLARAVVVQDEAAADGVVGALADQARRRAYAVKVMPLGWKGSERRRCRIRSLSGRTPIWWVPASRIRPDSSDLGGPERTGVGVDGLGILALQPPEHGVVAAVPVPGGAEGAEELRAVRGWCRSSRPPSASDAGEPAGRPHRADRVRAGRADADAEQVEDADRHRPVCSLVGRTKSESPAGSYPAGPGCLSFSLGRCAPKRSDTPSASIIPTRR